MLNVVEIEVTYQIEMRNTHQRPYYVQKDNTGAFVPGEQEICLNGRI